MSDDKAAMAALVHEAATGNRDAMERLLTRAQRTAYRFGLRVCGQPEDAEDVTQDALLKTFEHVDRISAPGAFRSWLFATVRNACLMKRRRRAGEPQRLLSIEKRSGSDDGEVTGVDVTDTARGPDEQAIDAWVTSRLRRALEALPPSYRTVVLLRDIEGLSTRQVAAIVGVSTANVKTRLHRARTLLREDLQSRSLPHP